MPHAQLDLNNDELLSTTRAVRKRLDLDRAVPRAVLEECLSLAVQAPSGSNAQGWQFMFVTEPDKTAKIGEYYRQSYAAYRKMDFAIHKQHGNSDDQALTASQQRSAASADHLAENMGRVPALLIPVIAGRTDGGASPASAQAGVFGSIIPAAWSFMLAARARGLGTAWTTLHLRYEREVAELLGIPYAQFMQVALIPIAYTLGTDFKPAYRPPLQTVMHFDQW